MPPLPHQTVIRLGLRLPPGRPGVELVPVDGECVVLSVNDGASPLEAGDVVELINDTAMTRLRGGMFAWRDLLSAGGDAVVRRAVTVTRRAGVDAEASETDRPTCFSFEGMEILDDRSLVANASSTKTDEAVLAYGGGSSSSETGDVGTCVGSSLTPSERWAKRNDPPPADEAEWPAAVGEHEQGKTAAERWLLETGAARRREREGEETTSAEEGMGNHFENSAGPEEGEGGAAASAADGDDDDALPADHDAPVPSAIIEANDDDNSYELDRAETGVGVAAADKPPADDPLAELRERHARLLGKDKGKNKGLDEEEAETPPRVPRWKTLTRPVIFFTLLCGTGYGLGQGVFYLIKSSNAKEDTVGAVVRPVEGEDSAAVPSATPRSPTPSPVDGLFG